MYTEQRQKLGANIQRFRKLKKLSQRALADKMETNQSIIWQIETGKISTGFDQICKLADALDVKPCDLIDF